jgi:membrane protease YdiL (CAAX protease family)
LLALGIVFWVAPIRRAIAGTLALKRPAWEAAALALLVAAFVIGIDHFFRHVAPIEVAAMVLFKYPKVDSPILHWTDVTYGLALTAISEEIVFRGLFAGLLARCFNGEAGLALASALFFALVHWSHGLTAMAVAFTAGVALMALYRRTGSLLPAIAAHYLVNLWDFV